METISKKVFCENKTLQLKQDMTDHAWCDMLEASDAGKA